jgi:gamma-glutamyltranspeptidase/glutathione hydrolase
VDGDGNADSELSQYSYKAVGVPGTVAGLALALKKYGTISLARALRPAIDYAENGFRVDPYLRNSLIGASKRMKASPASMEIFFRPNGSPYDIGDLLFQRDLAWSLKQIAKKGPDAFYKGEIAKKIAADMKAHDGLITGEDLAAYQAVERAPLHGAYRGYEVWSMPPPSSGGVHVIQMLNILEGWPKGFFGHNTPETIRLMAETMKLAYADRSEYLGDPDFFKVPVTGLTSKKYAAELRKKINLDKITPSSVIRPGAPGRYESEQTTHYSVADRWGNAVSVTYTLNFGYGTGLTAAGTGILLNDEMDDFSSKPGAPNAYGLLGNDANAIAPGKRMLSCMTPTIIMKDGAVHLVTGSPGGSRIITTVLQLILNVLDHDMNVADATNAVRIHHQWMPDTIRMERYGISNDVIQALQARGHQVEFVQNLGDAQGIVIDPESGIRLGASDPRHSGLAAGYGTGENGEQK